MLGRLFYRAFGEKWYSFIWRLIYCVGNFFCSLLPFHNEILLESHPDLTCNTWPLFQYMIKEKLNEKIKITWLVNKPEIYKEKYCDLKNVTFIEISPKGFFSRIKKYIRCNRAKCIIASNRFVSKNYF